ncbi:hypothetical protein KQX54_012187 [Cotesia glomerata]|uniref:Uncharacterized protein n=1 Tax=Cotesia glomerata TaxID=32391 RepID=A0AAV7HCZ4_COTGL|nr:hypothetical protein KQX54_012187 [Cotesia glomerata]
MTADFLKELISEVFAIILPNTRIKALLATWRNTGFDKDWSQAPRVVLYRSCGRFLWFSCKPLHSEAVDVTLNNNILMQLLAIFPGTAYGRLSLKCSNTSFYRLHILEAETLDIPKCPRRKVTGVDKVEEMQQSCTSPLNELLQRKSTTEDDGGGRNQNIRQPQIQREQMYHSMTASSN